MMSVPVLLNEAQKASAGAQLRYATTVWELWAEEPQRIEDDLIHALKLIVSFQEV